MMISLKTKSEIERMRKSGQVISSAFELLKGIIKPGVTTIELDRIVEEHIRKHGGIPSFKGYKGLRGAIDFPASICSSVNDEVVHGIPGLRELKNGDIISIDIGVYLDGYHADAARTFPVGEISDEASRLIEVTRKSFYEGIKHAIIGNRITDISSAVQKVVEGSGYSVVRDYVGHGIGKEMHEPPQVPNFVTRERGPRLEDGMTIAVEPMVNAGSYKVRLLENRWTVVTEDGSLSAHYENTIAVTKGEPIILTKAV
jgi:methionyl aminopeptidase